MSFLVSTTNGDGLVPNTFDGYTARHPGADNGYAHVSARTRTRLNIRYCVAARDRKDRGVGIRVPVRTGNTTRDAFAILVQKPGLVVFR